MLAHPIDELTHPTVPRCADSRCKSPLFTSVTLFFVLSFLHERLLCGRLHRAQGRMRNENTDRPTFFSSGAERNETRREMRLSLLAAIPFSPCCNAKSLPPVANHSRERSLQGSPRPTDASLHSGLANPSLRFEGGPHSKIDRVLLIGTRLSLLTAFILHKKECMEYGNYRHTHTFVSGCGKVHVRESEKHPGLCSSDREGFGIHGKSKLAQEDPVHVHVHVSADGRKMLDVRWSGDAYSIFRLDRMLHVCMCEHVNMDVYVSETPNDPKAKVVFREGVGTLCTNKTFPVYV